MTKVILKTNWYHVTAPSSATYSVSTPSHKSCSREATHHSDKFEFLKMFVSWPTAHAHKWGRAVVCSSGEVGTAWRVCVQTLRYVDNWLFTLDDVIKFVAVLTRIKELRLARETTTWTSKHVMTNNACAFVKGNSQSSLCTVLPTSHFKSHSTRELKTPHKTRANANRTFKWGNIRTGAFESTRALLTPSSRR
jgi:hypothetical protein